MSSHCQSVVKWDAAGKPACDGCLLRLSEMLLTLSTSSVVPMYCGRICVFTEEILIMKKQMKSCWKFLAFDKPLNFSKIELHDAHGTLSSLNRDGNSKRFQDDDVDEPNRTEPNRAEPNRTEPNRTEPNPVESSRALSSEWLLSSNEQGLGNKSFFFIRCCIVRETRKRKWLGGVYE